MLSLAWCVLVILIPKSLQQISDNDEQRPVLIDSNENVDASRTDHIETVTPYPIYLDDDVIHEKALLTGNKHQSSVRKNIPYIYPNFLSAGYYNDGRQLLRRRPKKRGKYRPKPYPKPTKPTRQRPRPHPDLDGDYDEDTELLNALIKLNGQFIFRSS
ncbi:uncharacterized protein LOC123704165 [Colias croceus]|uniref:uncharacterized protein LOC123704165 n=1 Tax=Colias crocea TaxID=72248 RepID=UPI001E27AE50|nr:uncharacterized protein LOC123704165 [Colias croceus]